MIQQTSDNNKKLLPSEELLWHRILTKGIFRKKIIEGLVVTDHRVIKELPQSGHLFTLLLSHQSFQVPIDSSITFTSVC